MVQVLYLDLDLFHLPPPEKDFNEFLIETCKANLHESLESTISRSKADLVESSEAKK